MTCTDQTEPMHTGPVQRLKLTNVMASSQLWATAACLITPNLKAKQKLNGWVAKIYICWGCKLDIYLTEALKAPNQPLCLCDWGLSLWIYWSNTFWRQPQLSFRATAEFDSSTLAQSFSPWGCSLYNRQFCLPGWCHDGVVVTEVLNFFAIAILLLFNW